MIFFFHLYNKSRVIPVNAVTAVCFIAEATRNRMEREAVPRHSLSDYLECVICGMYQRTITLVAFLP